MPSCFAELKRRLVRAMEVIAILHFIAALTGTLCTIALSLMIYLLWTPLYFVPLLYMVWFFYDYKTPYQAGRRIEFLRRLPVWNYLVSYFPITLHKTADLDPSKNYMFCFHPHGMYSFSCFANFATEATGFSRAFPGIKVFPLTLALFFNFPIFRDYVTLGGAAPASKESINYKLTKLGPGYSVTIIPGGALEAEISNPDNPYRLKLKNRRGFVREALVAGASLVPVFSFGEVEVLYNILPRPNTWLARLHKLFHNVFGGTPTIGHGACFLLPFRRNIDTVFGAPLVLPHLPDPTDDEVKYWHAKYVEALKKVFYDNKERFGSPGKDLDLF